MAAFLPAHAPSASAAAARRAAAQLLETALLADAAAINAVRGLPPLAKLFSGPAALEGGGGTAGEGCQ
eukprot:3472148-Pyramimonas_sp.AAC.1